MGKFYVEVTDTFNGEANYVWVRRYIVSAKSELGAIRKVGREEGLPFRKEWDDGLCVRYYAKGMNIAAFVSYFDSDCGHYGIEI